MDVHEARQTVLSHYPSAVGAHVEDAREVIELGYSALQIAIVAGSRAEQSTLREAILSLESAACGAQE